MAAESQRPPTERELRELAALADGSLPPDRRPAVEARVAASPRLQALLAEQQRALAAIRAGDEAAPPSLRAAVAAERARGQRRPRAPSLRLAAGLAALATALALVVLLALPASKRGGPTIAQAARLSTLEPQRAAPGPYPGQPMLLELEVEEVPYPNWERRFGWRAVGSRLDRIEGRAARTLFYERGGRRIGYTILSGEWLAVPGAERLVRDGTALRSFVLDGRAVVTWERRRHTCVLSGAGVSREALLRLGAWKSGGAIPY